MYGESLTRMASSVPVCGMIVYDTVTLRSLQSVTLLGQLDGSGCCVPE